MTHNIPRGDEMTTKKKVSPLDFPKEILVYDDEYFQRISEIEDDLDLDEPETDPSYIVVNSVEDVVSGNPVAKYVLVSVGISRTVVDFKKA